MSSHASWLKTCTQPTESLHTLIWPWGRSYLSFWCSRALCTSYKPYSIHASASTCRIVSRRGGAWERTFASRLSQSYSMCYLLCSTSHCVSILLLVWTRRSIGWFMISHGPYMALDSQPIFLYIWLPMRLFETSSWSWFEWDSSGRQNTLGNDSYGF